MVCENHIHVVTPLCARSLHAVTAPITNHDLQRRATTAPALAGTKAGGPTTHVRRHDADRLHLDDNWQDDANCLGVDPDLFFPERGASTREAKEVCRGCVVREQCLEFALQNGEKFGIWGGLSERERRRIRRQRAQAARSIVGA